MSKKDNTLLWIAGAGVVGWLLAPKEVKDKIQEVMGGGGGVGIDISGLLGGGIGQAPLGEGGIFPEFDFPKFEWPAFPEVPSLDYTGIIQDILDAGNTAAGVVGAAAAAAANAATGGEEEGGDVAPTPPPAPKGTWEWMMEEFTGLHPIVQNVLAMGGGVVAGAVGLGGVYGAVKGVQAVAPAARITTDAMARTFAAVLRGKPPVGKPPIPGLKIPTGLKMPAGVKPSLWRQWLKFTKLGKLGAGAAGLGLAPLGFMDIIQEFDWSKGPLGRGWPGEAADVTIPWTSKTWNMKPQPEGAYPKQPVPMRAEREYTPREPRPSYHEPRPTPLYPSPLEGVQW